jgi:mono/diheme cytochrome c family protein
MPYEHFRYMADDDVEALVAYLNSLKPVSNHIQRTELPVFIKMMIKGAPQPVEDPVQRPDRANRRQYGEYLVNLALCAECHTPGSGPNLDTSRRFAGGHRFDINGLVVVSANITPDPNTGIGSWTVDYFKERFHRYKDGTPPDAAGKFTIMPWHNLAQLPDEDLEAIYAYLRQQAPIENKVDRHPGPETSLASN